MLPSTCARLKESHTLLQESFLNQIQLKVRSFIIYDCGFKVLATDPDTPAFWEQQNK